MIKLLKYMNYLLMAYALSVAAFTIYQRIEAYMLAGACPLPMQRIWLYTGIGAAVISFALMTYMDRKKAEHNGSE